MKRNGAVRNVAIALLAFILWGNLISLLLPADLYGPIVRTVDFSTILFTAAILLTVLFGDRTESGDGREGTRTEPMRQISSETRERMRSPREREI